MSYLLPAKVINRFSFVTNVPTGMLPHISMEAIPIAYGGEKEIKDAKLSNGCNEPRQIGKDDYLVSKSLIRSTTIQKSFFQYNFLKKKHFVE